MMQADTLFQKIAAQALKHCDRVRLMLETTIANGAIPFRPDTEMISEAEHQKTRTEEMELLDEILGITQTTAREKLKTLFGELPDHSAELSDGQLREWADKCGLPESLSLTALGELYDTHLFPKDIWDVGFGFETTPNPKYFEEGAQRKSREDMMVLKEMELNLRFGIEDVQNQLLKNALTYLYEVDSIKDMEEKS